MLTVTHNINVAGGWDGSPTTPHVCDPNTYPTTIDGKGTRGGAHVSGDITVTLEGFTLTRVVAPPKVPGCTRVVPTSLCVG